MTRKDSGRARFGAYEVDLHTHELWKFGTRLKLVGQPFAILAVLLDKSGELVTREELRARLWPADTFVDFNHGLNAAVNKLREALSDSADAPRYVETLPRRGYRFIAKVEWVQASAASVAESAILIRESFPLLPEAADAQADIETGQSLAPRRWPQFVIGTAVVAGMLLVASFLLKAVSGDGSRIQANSSPQRVRALPGVGIQPAFSPDGNSVAFVRDHGNPADSGIFVAAVGSDQPLQLTHNDRDCCPVWSPDGRSIAFSRYANKEVSIYVVPAEGGADQKRADEKATNPRPAALNVPSPGSAPEYRINTDGVIPQNGGIDWTPDGKSIVFAGPSGLYLVSLDNSGLHRITEPPPMAEDWGPAFSPDGKRLLFVRTHQVGLPDEIWATSAMGGKATRILAEPGKIASPPRWSYDGNAIIYASNRSGHPALWRASVDAPDSLIQMGEGSPAWDPAISRRGYRMAYERIVRSLSIWQLNLSSSKRERPTVLVPSTSDTDQGPAPQFSPDGKKLAYMSDRSGTMEIWISNRDGSNPFQLTAVGLAGTPRWSPDSQSIVFDADSPDGSKILTIDLRGGAPRVLTPDKYTNQVPSWSRDGKWIYYASTRLGDREVWKLPASGGEPVQLTHGGGHAAIESCDGKVLYYAKTFLPEPEIWQVPVKGGPETPLPLVRPGTWASWQPVEGGILFVGPSLGHQAVLSFYDSTRQRTTTVAVLDRVPFWLGATLDRRTVAFDQPSQEQTQTMLVENFR